MNDKGIYLVCISYNTSAEVEKFFNIVKNIKNIKGVCLVDNKSDYLNLNKNRELCKKYGYILFENDKNYGFDYANNVGLRYVCETLKEKYVAIANTDVIFDDKVVDSLIDVMEDNSEIGVIAPSMINASDKSLVMSPRDFPTYISLLRDSFYLLRRRFLKKGALSYKRQIVNDVEIVDATSGGFMLFRCSALIAANYFDEKIFMYYDEDALCWRMKDHHFYTGYYPKVTIIHDHDFNKKNYIDVNKVSAKSARYFMKNYIKPIFIKYWFYVIVNHCHIVEMFLITHLYKLKKRKK